jgi:hypothetical protein
MPLNPFPDPQTYKIIGAGMAVHSELGCGFLEKVYRLALPYEFGRLEVPFAPEKNLKICYKGHTLAVDYFVDFICFGTNLRACDSGRSCPASAASPPSAARQSCNPRNPWMIRPWTTASALWR